MTVNSLLRCRGENYERLVRQERLILDVTERLTEALLETGVTKAELARRLDRTPGFVSQVLAGGRNLTLRTIADIAAALSRRPSLALSSGHRSVADSVHWTDQKRRWRALVAPTPAPFSASLGKGPAPRQAAA